MKTGQKLLTIALIILLGVMLGVFIYSKTGIKDFVEQKKNEKLDKDIVAKVADTTISEAESRVYLAAMRNQIESIYGEEVWDYKVDDDGTKYSELMKNGVLDKIIYVKLVCANAEGYGVTLTADDKLDVEEYVTDFFAGITEDTAKEYNLSKELVTKIYEENILAAKVYDKITLNYTVDANEENCRQGTYVITKINKFYLDTGGNKVYYSEEELSSIKSRANLAQSAMKGGDAYQVALNEGSMDEPRINCGIEYFPEEMREEVKALTDGQTGTVFENEESYIIVHCEEDYNEEATKKAIKQKIDADRDAYFNSLYTLWRDGAEIEIDKEKWEQIN